MRTETVHRVQFDLPDHNPDANLNHNPYVDSFPVNAAVRNHGHASDLLTQRFACNSAARRSPHMVLVFHLQDLKGSLEEDHCLQQCIGMRGEDPDK